MEQPLVSIVVVSYNHSKYIQENLDSIKAQTYPNIELIVADDASQDNSVEVFEAWLAENRYPAKKNFHTKNTGLATMLNECTEIITGKYVKFIAADDFLHPESVEKCVAKLEELGEEYGMIATNEFFIDEENNAVALPDRLSFDKISTENISELLWKTNPFSAPSVLMRTSALQDTGTYPVDLLCEDYFRWLAISGKYKISYLDEKLVYYRWHSANISKSRQDSISTDAIISRMRLDKSGERRKSLNFTILEYYRDGKISPKLKSEYQNYPYNSKRLAIALKTGIPYKIFSLLSKRS